MCPLCARLLRGHAERLRDDHPDLGPPLADQWQRLWGRIKRISPEVGDALLYGVSALFALLTISTSTNALYQVWGRMALLPFVFGAVASAVLAWAVRRVRRRQPSGALTKRQHRRAWLTRIIIAACVFAGALAIPMGFEILWRFDHVAGSHQQPEVVTVEVGGQDLVHDKDPYVVPVRLHHPVKYHPPGQPDFEGFLPYLPVMAIAGIPSEIWPNNGLSDARIFFCLTTLGVAAVALDHVPGGRATEDPRRSGPRHPSDRLIAPGDRRRRHPGGGVPAAGHRPGATATALSPRAWSSASPPP